MQLTKWNLLFLGLWRIMQWLSKISHKNHGPPFYNPVYKILTSTILMNSHIFILHTSYTSSFIVWKCGVISNSVFSALLTFKNERYYILTRWAHSGHDFWKATSNSGRFIHLKLLTKLLDISNSIRAVSAITEVLYPITISLYKK